MRKDDEIMRAVKSSVIKGVKLALQYKSMGWSDSAVLAEIDKDLCYENGERSTSPAEAASPLADAMVERYPFNKELISVTIRSDRNVLR